MYTNFIITSWSGDAISERPSAQVQQTQVKMKRNNEEGKFTY